MLNLIFTVLVALVFARIAIFGVKATWGIARLLVSVVFFPIIILFVFAKGLLFLAWPLLIIAGLYSLFFSTPNK